MKSKAFSSIDECNEFMKDVCVKHVFQEITSAVEQYNSYAQKHVTSYHYRYVIFYENVAEELGAAREHAAQMPSTRGEPPPGPLRDFGAVERYEKQPASRMNADEMRPGNPLEMDKPVPRPFQHVQGIAIGTDAVRSLKAITADDEKPVNRGKSKNKGGFKADPNKPGNCMNCGHTEAEHNTYANGGIGPSECHHPDCECKPEHLMK